MAIEAVSDITKNGVSAFQEGAPLDSPSFTGTPTAPTATAGTNTTQLATTAFVQAGLGTKANLASPAFTGTPTAPTQTAGNNTTRLATTAFVTTAVSGKANLASPTFTGTPAAPTAAPGTNTTQLATTAFVQAAISGLGGGGTQVKALGTFCSGKPANDQIVGGWIIPYAMTFSATNSDASATVAATGSTVFVIKNNGTQIGTITFNAGGSVGAYSITTAAVAANDLITITGPSTADATLANIAITLVE